MKKLFFVLTVLLFAAVRVTFAQGTSINTTGAEPHASAILDISSTNQGILLPRLTAAQRTAIPSPAAGLMVYQTDASVGFHYYNGSQWSMVGNTPAGSTIGDLLYWNGTNWTVVPAGVNGQVLTMSGGIPVWSGCSLPDAGAVSGTATVTVGASVTLTGSVSGGSWSSSNTTVATVGTAGAVTGIAAGTSTISYTVANSCGSASATLVVTVTAPSITIGASYGGGVIAYILQPGDPGYSATTVHGLIAAAADQSVGATWYNGSSIATGATGTAIGTGAANTTAIVTAQGSGSYAAIICENLVLNGYSDWYLPSKDELAKLLLNKAAIGGFVSTGASNFYWSSSEMNPGIAWMQYAVSGGITGNGKNYSGYVRAIRGF
jgi:hypothetical protein